ncbi:MAG: hypothetical protein IJT18_05850 [Oscillospiraceae bacterium]|nr:hypothetical protein [Oscillospiraceae bacterium]
MSNYIPVYAHPDRMPVDISFVFENEKPSGKHGFCKVDGEHFVFEDGTRAAFWGVILNGAASFPEHEYSEKLARRLAQAGVNIVRFHQLDSEWATPNIYRITAGKTLHTTRVLCEESLDRMDYLIKCLKEQGIYATVDMTTYRKFKTGDGVVDADKFMLNVQKIYAIYDPTMIELQKEFCNNYWNHFNPYTGLKYKDDPFFVMCDIINENDMFKMPRARKGWQDIPYYDNMFLDMFRAWVKENGIDYDVDKCVLYDKKDETQIAFRTYLHKKYCEDMYAYIRSLGVRVPLTGTNWTGAGGLVKAQENMDFQDGHCYFYDWNWGEYEKVTANVSLTGQKAAPLGGACTSRIAGKPMFMTEWNMPFSNSYRAEGPIWFPAVAALQGWGGMSIHTYAYGTHLSDNNIIGKEATSLTIGGIPYREGIFSCWNDPASFGLFYHGALMLRRGDVAESQHTVGNRIKDMGSVVKTLTGSAMEIHKVASVLDTTDTSKLAEIFDEDQAYPHEDPNVITSDTGEIFRDKKRKLGGVKSPRTKAVYGFFGSKEISNKRVEKIVDLDGVTVNANTDFGVIAISSLTDDPICHSDNMLLTAVGRARNTDMQFDGEKLIDYGHPPVLIEVIDAEIRIKTDRPNLFVWGINSDGYYVGRLDSVYEDGELKFHIGPHFPAQYYLIMEE